MSGEAALVVAARGGQSSVLRQLLSSSHSPSLSQQASALYAAARAGQLDAVKCLINFGASIDIGIPEPPLIGALVGGHTGVALYLIQHGADCDVKDTRGNSCLYLASSAGLYEVVRSLCAIGCVQGPNARGQYPLHIAARNGHIQVVRLLCFYGCKLDQKNGDGIRADITALKYGHNNIAELLDKLRASGYSTAALRSQLLPGNRALLRPQVKLLGHSGVGKTSLATSLKAGLLHALFRRSSSLTTRSRPSSPSQLSQIEMDVTPRHNSLSFDACVTSEDYEPTKGLNVHQLDLNGVGDITLWDFSGQESYFQMYHYFLSDANVPLPSSLHSAYPSKCAFAKGSTSSGCESAKYTAANDNVITSIGKTISTTTQATDPTGGFDFLPAKSQSTAFEGGSSSNRYASMLVYAVLFSLEKPYGVQLQQCVYWLNFVVSKLSPCKKKGGLGNVILIATHADIRAHRTAQGDFVYPAAESLLRSVQEKFGQYFQIHNQVMVGYWSGFLEGALAWIANMRKVMDSFPVMTKDVFMANVRSHVNLLASDEHIIDIIHHLHVLGEIMVFGNFIVLCPDWMGQILGTLFGKEGLQDARIIGVYTAHDFQAHFGYCDATQLLELLQELRLCSMCEVDDEIEYEFPCFNLVEQLDGLWDPEDTQYKAQNSCYGGLKLCQTPGTTHLILNIFPHIQVELRDHVEALKLAETDNLLNSDCDLYQWWHGSKLCWGPIECLLVLNGSHGSEYLDLRVRGPPDSGQACLLVMEKVLAWIGQALSRVACGITLERHILSAQQLRLHCDEPHSWSMAAINRELSENFDEESDNTSYSNVTLFNPITGKSESMMSLLFFDYSGITDVIEWFPNISTKKLDDFVLARLAAQLDPPHPLGTHWCMLAVSLGVSQETIAAFDSEADIWHTSKLFKSINCPLGVIVRKLIDLDRQDAVNIILSLTPIYNIVEMEKSENSTPKENSSPKQIGQSKMIGQKIHTEV